MQLGKDQTKPSRLAVAELIVEANMSRYARPGSSKQKAKQDWPAVVYVWMIALGILGYLVAGEFVLMTSPHPLHWAAGLAGAALGVPVGWLWYRWRGDIF